MSLHQAAIKSPRLKWRTDRNPIKSCVGRVGTNPKRVETTFLMSDIIDFVQSVLQTKSKIPACSLKNTHWHRPFSSVSSSGLARIVGQNSLNSCYANISATPPPIASTARLCCRPHHDDKFRFRSATISTCYR